jgi:hypothetical protein
MAVRGTAIKLVTKLLQANTWDNTTASDLPWFSGGLEYAWSFTIAGQQISRHYNLDLFSCSYPSRFEVELDAALDKLVFGDPNKNKDASALYLLYLRTEAYP